MAASLASSSSSSMAEEEIPFLPTKSSGLSDVEGGIYEGYGGASVSSGVFNLLTSTVGAGIMALPATQKRLGIVGGTVAIVLIGLLTDASLEFLVRFAKACKVQSYGAVMGDAFGNLGRIMLQLCVIINNIGLLVVYMIILGDVLSGTQDSGAMHHTGVLEEWAGGAAWWNGRVVVLLFTTLIFLLPLISVRRLDSLRFTSALSIALAVVFVVIMGWIVIAQLAAGELNMPRLLPDVHDQISFWKLFTTVPVIVTAYICHHNVHPIANELKDSSSMTRICRLSVFLCLIIYIVTASFGYLLFGDSTMDDVLSNFDTDLGLSYGHVLNAVVRISYALHLVLVFPLIHFSLRLNLDALIFPSAIPISEDTPRFIFVTSILIGTIFFLSTLVPNIWTAFQFTGATAAVCLGFIFPGIIALRDTQGIASKSDKCIAWIMVVLAVVCSVTAITTNVLDLIIDNRSVPSSHGMKLPRGFSYFIKM